MRLLHQRISRRARPMNDLYHDDSGIARCHWCHATQEYVAYHDHEWGFPVDDDQKLFEKISLEGFQAGLSWLTILKKLRENSPVF